nr:hypothetical protein Iba_chr14aCG12430 [Ipomoea batatas]
MFERYSSVALRHIRSEIIASYVSKEVKALNSIIRKPRQKMSSHGPNSTRNSSSGLKFVLHIFLEGTSGLRNSTLRTYLLNIISKGPSLSANHPKFLSERLEGKVKDLLIGAEYAQRFMRRSMSQSWP